MSTTLDPYGSIPVTVVSGATGTGPSALLFCVPPKTTGGDRTLTLLPNLTGAFTTLTADLELSEDGGTTWRKVQTGLDLHTGTAVQVLHPPASLPMRLNVTGFAGGTSASVDGVCN